MCEKSKFEQKNESLHNIHGICNVQYLCFPYKIKNEKKKREYSKTFTYKRIVTLLILTACIFP